VKFSAALPGLDRLMDGLEKFGEALAAPATEAAAEALAETLRENRSAQALDAPLARSGAGASQAIVASDPESVRREFGTIDLDATPWLAPSLPAAQGPMRAAVVTAVARAISMLRLTPGE
jgi:hypothetical protein